MGREQRGEVWMLERSTPRPWKAYGATVGADGRMTFEFVPAIYPTKGQVEAAYREECEADAALIAHAVNTYEVLRSIADLVQTHRHEDYVVQGDEGTAYCALCAMLASAAISDHATSVESEFLPGVPLS